AAGHAQQAKSQNDGQGDGDGLARDGGKEAEIQHDHNGNEGPEQQKEFALRLEIGFASFVNELGDVAHGLVDRQMFQARVNGESEGQAEQAEENPEKQEFVAVHAEEGDLGKVGQLQ